MARRAGSPRAGAVAALLLIVGLAATGQDRLAQLRSEFAGASDPVRKAKLLAKLGPLEIQQVREDAHAGKAAQALSQLEEYRDQVHAAHTALKATGVDAEKRYGGFKQLQITVREAIRQIDDILFALAVDQRPPFRQVREDLDGVNSQLMHALFPRQGAAGKPKS